MNGKDLHIDGFSPNCLVGVTGAVARSKYMIKNINRIYFHHSYTYQNNGEIKYLPDVNSLNICFTREIPISKDSFIERLFYYYALTHSYMIYSDFEYMVNDIARLNAFGEPIMIEIDFFFMKKHRFYKKVHDQHMMIIYDVDLEQKQFSVCEAVFGQIKISFEEYYEYFKDVNENRNRGIFVLRLSKKNGYDSHKIRIDYFIKDIEKTLENLVYSDGLSLFNQFSNDFINFLEKGNYDNNFFIPGMWVFMCDSMNNVNFINEFKNDYIDFESTALDEVRKCSIITNRKWFYLTMALNDIGKYKIEDISKALKSIEDADTELVRNLKLLKNDLIEYNNKHH